MFVPSFRAPLALALLSFAACGDSTGPGQDQELISRVSLIVTPQGGGTAQTVYVDDPDGLGPTAPSAQVGTLQLRQGVTYTGTVLFENRLVTPVENITTEVAEEAETHMVIYSVGGATGTTWVATDSDANARPVGLQYTITPGATLGAGTVRVVLCHFDAIPKPVTATSCSGDTDIDVTLNFSVIAPPTLRD